MNKHLIFSLFFVLTATFAKAQFTVTGQLKDTTNEVISAATVMLLNVKDSTLMNFTTSDPKGNFAFKNIKKTNYILAISHVGYLPKHIPVQPAEEKELNMGVIKMTPIAYLLMEVVIREAKAPIFVRGDTVEYDATTFKVPPGSTVEDLLRRLPGIDVDTEGNISTMGQGVKTVYVDGKAFFGNDPKTVTQNLDAQAVSKVQVFTEKSEQEKITGISDGSQEKVMNLELKDEYKKGYFGKASGGYGWGEGASYLWLAKGNFNWFTDKQQLSFIAFGNNLNQSNYSWEDMSEFRGQSMQTGNDNGDFGFNSSSGMRYFSYTSYGPDGSGFSKNGGGGVNYNYYHKKIKFNAGYLYTVNKSYSNMFSNRQTFLEDSVFWRIDTTYNENMRQNHSFSTRFEYDIDSSNNIIIRSNVNYLPNKRINSYKQLYQTSGLLPINLHSVDNEYEKDNLDFNFLTIYNHKFEKKRRTFAMSGFYNFKNGNDFEDINNINEFYAASPSDFIKLIIKNNKNSDVNTVKSSVLYVEPIGNRFSLLGFYNFKNTLSNNQNYSTDKQSADIEADIEIDSLWLKYQNNTLFNRVGTSITYGYKGINITLGGALQSLSLNGICERKPQIKENLNVDPYNNFIPYLSTHLQLPKNIRITSSYTYDVSEPDISYLFPMPDLSSTMYKILGNPNLKPERFHKINGRFNSWNNASMVNFSISANAEFYDNQIVYNRNTLFVDSLGYVTISEPANVTGGNSFSSHFWTNFPIIKTVLTMSVSANGRLSDSPIFINGIENITNSKRYGGNIGFNLTIGQNLSFNTDADMSQTFTQYSIQKDRNQDYINYGTSLTAKWQFLKKTYLEGTYRFSKYSNSRLDFNQNINTLNVSVRQVIGKKNQWETRLAAMDILNQNEFIRQYAGANYVEYRTSPTIARYFFLTVSYNIKGFEVKNTESEGRRGVRVIRN